MKRLARIGFWLLRLFRLERFLLAGLALAAAGVTANGVLLYLWVSSSFGPIAPELTSLAVLASTLTIAGVQMLFSSFFLGILRGALTHSWVD